MVLHSQQCRVVLFRVELLKFYERMDSRSIGDGEARERREIRLQRRRERECRRRAEETAEQMAARLSRRREKDRARRQQLIANETPEERESRLAKN